MASNESFICKIYVSEDEIYSGDLSEVPEQFRQKIISDLGEWASTLGKRGLNELVYSHLAWYEERGLFCGKCVKWVEEEAEEAEEAVEAEFEGRCGTCGEKLGIRYIYQRNEKLDKIITCVGLISEVRVSGS